MDAAANADGLAKRRRPHRTVLRQQFQDPLGDRRIAALPLDRPRLLVIIEKKRLMCYPANQVVASAIRYKPRLPHVEQCVTKPITMSMLLCQ